MVSLGNMGMRGAALAGRFVLSIYLTRMLGYRALGAFGLISGCAGVLPAVVGGGISYYVNRELLIEPRAAALCLLRDRLSLSAALALALLLIALGLMATGAIPAGGIEIMGAAIVALEIVSFDLHIAMINLREPVGANFLLFVRSAIWIGPVVACGVISPALRNFDVLLAAWLAALVVNFALLPILLPDWWGAIKAGRSIEWGRLRGWARQSKLIWINDVANVSQTYLDRFVVADMLGVSAAGTYTLYFSVTQGIYILIATATTQLAMPRLIAARDSGGLPAWTATMRSEGWRAMVMTAAVVTTVIVLTFAILPALGFANFTSYPGFFAIMTATAVLKPLADLASTGLYSVRADRALALSNLGGAVFGLLGGIAAVRIFGLIGIALCAVATQMALITVRFLILRRLAQAKG